MSTGDLLSIEPLELRFPFELKKQISCTMQLTNKTDSYVAFKVKTTNPKKYCVRPNTGIVMPRSSCNVTVTMQAQKEAPADMQCKDKFLLQCAVADSGATPKDITPEMFSKESGNIVEECKLKVAYVSPPRPPSPVPEGSDEGSSPRASVSDNGSLGRSEFTAPTKTYTDTQDSSSQTPHHSIGHMANLGSLRLQPPYSPESRARALIAKLTDEKNSAIQQNKKLQQELEVLRREASRGGGGMSFMYVIIVGIIGLLLGYILKKA